jgi:hypothetical protein
MPTTADHLQLAHAYLRLAEGGDAAPASRAGSALVAVIAAFVLATATPALWAAPAANSRTDRPSATLPGKVAPAFEADDVAPGG